MKANRYSPFLPLALLVGGIVYHCCADFHAVSPVSHEMLTAETSAASTSNCTSASAITTHSTAQSTATDTNTDIPADTKTSPESAPATTPAPRAPMTQKELISLAANHGLRLTLKTRRFLAFHSADNTLVLVAEFAGNRIHSMGCSVSAGRSLPFQLIARVVASPAAVKGEDPDPIATRLSQSEDATVQDFLISRSDRAFYAITKNKQSLPPVTQISELKAALIEHDFSIASTETLPDGIRWKFDLDSFYGTTGPEANTCCVEIHKVASRLDNITIRNQKILSDKSTLNLARIITEELLPDAPALGWDSDLSVDGYSINCSPHTFMDPGTISILLPGHHIDSTNKETPPPMLNKFIPLPHNMELEITAAYSQSATPANTYTSTQDSPLSLATDSSSTPAACNPAARSVGFIDPFQTEHEHGELRSAKLIAIVGTRACFMIKGRPTWLSPGETANGLSLLSIEDTTAHVQESGFPATCQLK